MIKEIPNAACKYLTTLCKFDKTEPTVIGFLPLLAKVSLIWFKMSKTLTGVNSSPLTF